MTDRENDLFGDWQAVTGVLGGADMPDAVVAATKLSISDGRYCVDLAGVPDSGQCHIDADVSPMRMKIVAEQGPNAGKTILAIVESISADEMRIAYDLSGDRYPATFDPQPEKISYVATFRRCAAE